MDTTLNRQWLRTLVKAALEEDVGRGDLTSLACLELDPVTGHIVAKSDGILSGQLAALMVFEFVDSANIVRFIIRDGERFSAGDVIANIEGFNQTVLTSERVALNFLGRLSGIATRTREFVEKIASQQSGTPACRILDTRKTAPGFRQLEKMAVVHGGGSNHRMGLYDMILIKDNHIASAGSVKQAIERARQYLTTSDYRLQFEKDASEIRIEAEVTDARQLAEAIDAGADRILLDNQSPDSLKRLVQAARSLNPKVEIEASGNVTLDNVMEIAATGVDYISVGAITHSAPVSDFSLQIGNIER